MKTVNFKFLIGLLLFVFSFEVSAQTLKNPFCKPAHLAIDSGRDLYSRGQFLLSVQEFSMAEKFDCADNINQAMWGHLLAVTELGERDEMFHLSHKVYPSKFSLEYQEKLKIYKSYYFPSNKISRESQLLESFTAWKENLPHQRSPAVAGTLSAVLPGAGQAYTGSWQSGAMALVLNALFLATTVELADNDLHAASLASGVVFSITYLGNILNAAESARIYNQNYYKPQIEAEKAKRFPELNL
jgi:hypothetical protein